MSTIFLREKEEPGKFRPIINLRQLNENVPYQKFKMESLKDLKNLLKKRDLLVKIDLKDAYFTVPLNQESEKFVRFQWNGNLFEFICLMFGLGLCPRIFTKLLKIPITILRRLNIRLIIYIDGTLIMGSSMSKLLMARDTMLYLLEELGFVINYEKSVLTSSTVMGFLGILINSQTMTLTIPQEKMRNFSTYVERHWAQNL